MTSEKNDRIISPVPPKQQQQQQQQVANSYPRVALEHLCRLLFLHDFDVARARLDVVPDGDNGNITMLRMLVTPIGDNNGSSDVFDVLTREIKRCKWLDPLTMDLVFDRYVHSSI